MDYDNFSVGRIISTTIFGKKGDNPTALAIYIAVERKSYFNYSTVLNCQYILDDFKQETLFINEINSFLEKSTVSYWRLGKLPWLSLTIFALVCLLFIITFESGATNIIVISSADFIPLIGGFITGLFIPLVSILFDRIIFQKLFPPIVFCWGEEVEAFDRKAGLRTNLFWVVIVGIIIGFAVTLITNLF